MEINGEKEAIEAEVAAVARAWDVKPQNTKLDHFDNNTGKFVFTEGKAGKIVDQEKLAAKIEAVIASGDYKQTIDVPFLETAPEDPDKVKSQYQTLATFTTKTTSNAKRNTNVRLAAEALNGTIVQPGEEFSFNEVVGQRTEEKGYQAAAAYSSGEVVQEIGGGVCQISSTLYRVVFQSGMEITYRRSATFESNYVTPGQDEQSAGNSRILSLSIVQRGRFASGPVMQIRKRPFQFMEFQCWKKELPGIVSEKTGEGRSAGANLCGRPRTLEPGTEKVEKAGTNGTTWVTYKVVYKDGKEIERIKDHEKTYKGHAAVIRRNTSDKKLSPEETESVSETTVAQTVDGMPDDYVPGEGVTVSPEPSLEASKESKEEIKETSLPENSGTQSATEPENTDSGKTPTPEETLPTVDPLNP